MSYLAISYFYFPLFPYCKKLSQPLKTEHGLSNVLYKRAADINMSITSAT